MPVDVNHTMAAVEAIRLVLTLDSGAECNVPVPLASIQGSPDSLLDNDAKIVIRCLNTPTPIEPVEDWQLAETFEVSPNVDQTCLPTYFDKHTFSSLYEAYLALLLKDLPLSQVQYHPKGVMQFPDFYVEPASAMIPELDQGGIYIEYKPSFPSENTITQAFNFLFAHKEMSCMLIAYGNPLHTDVQTELTYVSLRDQSAQENKCKDKNKGLRWLVVHRPPPSTTETMLQTVTVVPPMYLSDGWLLGTVNGNVSLYPLGRIVVDGLKCAIAVLSRCQPTQQLLKRVITCAKNQRKKKVTACVLRSNNSDDDELPLILELLTQHVTGSP